MMNDVGIEIYSMKTVGKDNYDEYVGIEICDVHRMNIFFSIDHSGKHWPGCAILVGYFGIEVISGKLA